MDWEIQLMKEPKHEFKIIYSEEDDVYRIVDLTDTSIVGVTEMYVSWDEFDRETRAERNREIKEKKVLGAKVNNYGVFIFLDTDNTKPKPVSENDYILSILRQMAIFFKEEEINTRPDIFEEYIIRKPSEKTASNQSIKTNIDSTKAPIIDDNVAQNNKKSFPLWAKITLIAIGIIGISLLIASLVDLITPLILAVLLGLDFLFKRK